MSFIRIGGDKEIRYQGKKVKEDEREQKTTTDKFKNSIRQNENKAHLMKNIDIRMFSEKKLRPSIEKPRDDS